MTPNQRSALSIANASQAAFECFYENLFSDSDLSTAERRRALHLVSDPVWRPLCELEANGVTSFEGAMVLLGAKLIRTSSFRVRSGPAAGLHAESVDLTELGMQYFQDYAGCHPNTEFRGKLIDSLQSYVAIDAGAGVVGSRSLVEGAIENDDWEILKRVRSILDGHFMFQSIASDYCMPASERAAYLKTSTNWGDERRGSDFLRLTPSI